MAKEKSAILIAGPTASGKSALAMKLARARNGVVINADSMQVYRELRLLTARPSEADEALVPHALYGHVAGKDGYSAGRYCIDAAQAVAQARKQDRVPIIVGGTGLYFRALLTGLSPIPDVPADIRQYWRDKGARHGAAWLFDELKRRDEIMAAKLRPTDPQRLMRALEVLDATGRSLAYWQSRAGTPVLSENETERHVICPERGELYRRCDERFETMMQTGAVEEVRQLLELKLAPDLPVMRALGVRPIGDYLAGMLKRDEAVSRAKTETRQFAKRQITWLRRNMMSWKWNIPQ
ncbi:MAG TPA: tRNA (adenosine(37)-N6)-dimethylallyltransferase MiaA [Rhizobiales bacterium]|nr:tRNA (adenosine(37)-N6)-dimethylallyltransferase MiaA [Hyphomicrobiales bacterium]